MAASAPCPWRERAGIGLRRLLLLLTFLTRSLVAGGADTANLSPSSTPACSAQDIESCTSHIVPFHDFNAVFPVVEYCVQPGRGYLPVTRHLCESWHVGAWTVRSDYAKEEDRSQAYTCSVCTSVRDLKSESSSQAVWLLQVPTDTTYSRQVFDEWGKILGTRVERISVQGGKKYVTVMGTYDKVQSLLESPSTNFLAWQPIPPELKVSPRLADPSAAPAPSNITTTTGISVKVRTLITAHGEDGHRAYRHESARSSLAKALEARQADWCHSEVEGLGGCHVKSLSTGQFLVSNIRPSRTLEAATHMARVVPEAITVDMDVPVKAFNYEASFLTQSGTNSTSAGADRTYWRGGKLTGKGVVVGVADTGLDYNSCFFYDKDNPVVFSANSDGYQVFSSSSHRKIRHYYGFADTGEHEESGHGTHVSGSVAGYPAYRPSTSTAFKYQGMAYDAKLAFFDIGQGTSSSLDVPNDLDLYVFPVAYSVGARLHSNSWGVSLNEYDILTQTADLYSYDNQDFLILFAAGNDGTNGNFSVSSPSTAKNVLSVGATKNGEARPDLAYFSSRGPTFDYRLKPDLCAPGYFVYSANSEVNGAPGQCSIVGMAGTSMATPVTAGNAAIIYEYFTKGYYPLGYANSLNEMEPMGALIKAVLINSARKMTGYEANLHNSPSRPAYPNFDQGHGILDVSLSAFLSGSRQRVLFTDGAWSSGCTSCPQFTVTAQTKSYTIVPIRSRPIYITLVYHDYPSASVAGGLVNDLDLKAVQGGTTYYPNGRSSPDTYNNVEEVVIDTPTVGVPIIITLTATSITYSPQPYAIAVSGYFRKDANIFPDSVPQVTRVASYHDQLLFIGANFPPSASVNATINLTCVSGPTIMKPTVVGYSSTGSYLAVNIDNTDCHTFLVTVHSDNFLGVTSGNMVYGALNISSECHTIAADSVCAYVAACQGRCILEPDHGSHYPLRTIAIMAGFGALIAAIITLIVMRTRKYCGKRPGAVKPGSASPFVGYEQRRLGIIPHAVPRPTGQVVYVNQPGTPGVAAQQPQQFYLQQPPGGQQFPPRSPVQGQAPMTAPSSPQAQQGQQLYTQRNVLVGSPRGGSPKGADRRRSC